MGKTKKSKNKLNIFESFYYFFAEHPEAFSGVPNRKSEKEAIFEMERKKLK